MSRLGLIAALAWCASACSSEPPPLVLECHGACDSQPPPLLGVQDGPEALRCEIAPQDAEVRCDLIPDHPLLRVESATVQVSSNADSRPSGSLISDELPSVTIPLPPTATEVTISARFRISGDPEVIGLEALGGLHSVSTVSLESGSVRATLDLPIHIWRMELLGHSPASLDLSHQGLPLTERLAVESGARLPVAVVLPPGATSIEWSGTVDGEVLEGSIEAATVLAITEQGIAPATAEQIPDAPRGTVALDCHHDSQDSRLTCSMPALAGDALSKIAVDVYGMDGSHSSFQVSPRFPTHLLVEDHQLPATIVSRATAKNEVFGLPITRRAVELRGTVDVDGSAELSLPFDIFSIELRSDVDVAGLIIPVRTLELGMALPGWFRYLGYDVELSMPRSDEFVRLMIATPTGVDSLAATIRTVDDIESAETSAQLISGTKYLILDSGLAIAL